MDSYAASTGHDPAFVYDPQKDRFQELKGKGLALGVDENFSYEENEMTGISTGSIAVLFTDGIWEAQNPAG